ncbi:type IV toxin-antitoxin system AbiEi family antitoxin domain-containing protein [Dyella flagellata]|uniref:AbiEi antitoxin C-terminal domain-containing protein n=1 Tax=Dyella flagellata TaxID=1867833 RepID=A0ABQ5XES6_9GAMM|nr:hypothetical protein [Dyella flagellata]GLQ89151.1 hypothetical protein GCM10007898_27230 [Dyella flagellata]
MPPAAPLSQQIALPNAVELLVRAEVTAPVLSEYDLARLVFGVVTTGLVEGRELKMTRREPRRSDFTYVRRVLIGRGVLNEDRSLPRSVLRTLAAARPDPEVILCSIDPFGYISHLSAMVYHGLSNRLPKLIFFTSPAAKQWRELADGRMKRDLGEALSQYQDADLPRLVRHKITKIQGLTLSVNQIAELGGGFRIAQDGLLRVSTLGRTYLDMLRRPDLCGGMSHVIEIFEESASRNLTLIVSELEKHGSKIDRVRAGYIIEERCGLSDSRIDAWVKDAQRGGSRRLDPEREYMPTFSERWMLSINV